MPKSGHRLVDVVGLADGTPLVACDRDQLLAVLDDVLREHLLLAQRHDELERLASVGFRRCGGRDA